MPTLSRRYFLSLAAASAVMTRCSFAQQQSDAWWLDPYQAVLQEEWERVLHGGRLYLGQKPITITSARASCSAGGIHDYYSQGDYWWPNPKDPSGPYIRRDGESNPRNFVAHRDLLIRLSIQMPALTAAWLVTGDSRYADRAAAHLQAWFIDPATHMNPNLMYAQAIVGRDTGRSIGIIDTLHLVEVAQAARVLEQTGGIHTAIQQGTRTWFSKYLDWLTNSARGRQERDKKNNHGTAWLLQAAEFATYTGNTATVADCRDRFMHTILPEQVAANGSLPRELARTKPYSYSLFDLDVLGMSAHVLSDSECNVWTYKLPDQSGLREAFRFMCPYIEDKQKWPFRPDVEYFNDLPVRQPSLLFAGLAYHRPDYLSLWQRLNPDPTVPEIIRNHPVRQPLLWIPRKG